MWDCATDLLKDWECMNSLLLEEPLNGEERKIFVDLCLYCGAVFVRLEIREKHVYICFLHFHDCKKSLIPFLKCEEE